MDNLLIYLIKVSAGTMLFYLCYFLFFSRDTFYLRNRIYLIAILLLSIIIPLMKVFNISTSQATIEQTNTINDIILSGSVIGTTVSQKIISFNLNNFLLCLYFSIAGLILLRGLISISRTLMIIRKGIILDTNFPKVILSDLDHPPFSFFPYVVIPKKTYEIGDYSELLAHENAHIRQGHTFDLLFSELLIAFLWFNPFIWLIKRSIILNHEYLADNFSLKYSFNRQEYQYKLLNISTELMSIPLAHNFSSLIKNRIVMINKKPTRNYAAMKNIIILPVLAILFIIFSFRPESNSFNSNSQESLFSKTSTLEILKFLGVNSSYPQEAKNSLDTGRVFVVVKIDKGGIIKETKAFLDKKDIKVPIMKESLVIVGYKPPSGQSTIINVTASNEHQLLKSECLRLANKLGDINIPEWKEKNMEFALDFRFVLEEERTMFPTDFNNSALKDL